MTRSQLTLTGTGFEKYTKRTRRAQFLAEMERVVPWRELCARIEPVYPKAGNGRPPVGVERMLRMYFLQHWFNLSDPAVEEALYDSPTMRAFVGIDLGREPVPDETTICKFRHRLEAHGLGRALSSRLSRRRSFFFMQCSTRDAATGSSASRPRTASVRTRRSRRVTPMSALVVDPLLCHLEGVGVGVRLGIAHLLERGQRPYSDTTALVNAHQRFRSPATTF
jgi:hypothetical protein